MPTAPSCGYLWIVDLPNSSFRSGQKAQFTTTRWSVVLTATDADADVAQAALEQLCRLYWYPLYAFSRRRGYGPEDAQDLTQGFFERVIEKKFVHEADRQLGKFRTFLLTTFNHFLADERVRSQRIKRGGEIDFTSLDGATAEERYRLEPADRLDPTKLFERNWATTLLDRALTRLEEDFRGREQFASFREFSPFLIGEQGEETHAQIAARLGTTAAAVKMAISRMRARYREILREEILQTVSSPEEAEEELLALKAALRP